MATLEKIRSKSVFLIIVIGVALLAFIVGDAITNGRNLFGDHTTVAKVGSEKIDYTDYMRKREELNNQLEQMRRQNPAQVANFDNQLISQMALDQLIGERLLDKAAAKAGVRSSSEQLRFYVLDNPVNPRIQEILQQLNTQGVSVSTPQQAYEIIFNPTRNGFSDADMAPYQRAWIAMEEETKQLINRQTYQRLLYGTVKANELDKKALYNDYVSTRNVDIAYHPYGQLDAAKYPVDENALKSEYNNVKDRFRVEEPTKDVAFIAVNITPSAADTKAAKVLAQKTVEALTDSTGQIDKDLKKEGIVATRKELRASDITDVQIKEFVMSADNGAVKLISDNIKGFTIVKMGKKTQAVDSIQLNIVNVVGEALPGKVLAELNKGFVADSLASRFGADSVMVQKGQWIPLMTAQGRTGVIEQGQLDSLLNAGGKYISLMSTPQGSVLAQVSERKSPKTVYEFEEVNYDLKPSTMTLNEERAKLEKFLEANPTTKAFMANAAKAGYSVQDFTLSATSPAVPRVAGMQNYFPDSRQVVRWVMIDGKPGEVSHIYESKDAQTPALYAVAIVNEYEDYAPLSNKDVNAYVTDRARKNKAGDELMKQYQPKAGTMASAAQAMGAEPQNNPNFRFGRNAQVRDAEVMGKIAGSKPGKVILVKGDNGIYAYQVTKESKENFPYSETQYEQQYFQLVNPNLPEMLKGASKIKNNIFKFEAGD
ncbi:MAG: SurA N-terminal domain-containing protein [Muribaculaceae bacterium]|nr:SurA N-terminal domain-containing protein [Muribaculaceae bacterium]MDE6753201.1 SurA N-terminal domain-containing protein [Muribaculaceae bacterium]